MLYDDCPVVQFKGYRSLFHDSASWPLVPGRQRNGHLLEVARESLCFSKVDLAGGSRRCSSPTASAAVIPKGTPPHFTCDYLWAGYVLPFASVSGGHSMFSHFNSCLAMKRTHVHLMT